MSLFKKKLKPIEVVSEPEITYEDRTLPQLNVTPTSSGLYISHYDENGNPVYTNDYKQSMGYTPDNIPDPVKEKKEKMGF